MDFARAFRLSSYLLLLAGFNALFTAEAVGPVVTVLYLAAMAVHWRVGDLPLPPKLQAAIFLIFLSFFVVDVAFLHGPVQASVHLLILISLVKLFTVKGDRDYLLIYSISFTFLLIASTYTISIVFLFSLVVYFFFCILTFILFESKRAYQENRAAKFSLRSYLQMAGLITLMIIVISVPIFLAIPRGALGLFKGGADPAAGLSGFSDRVNLGDIGRIISNRSVFMRISVDWPAEQVPFDLKWRGVALDNFDGRAWSNDVKEYSHIPDDRPSRFPSPELEAKRFLIPAPRRLNESILTQTISVEPASQIIFGADQIVQVAGNRIRESHILRDQSETLSFLRAPRGSLGYTVHSDLATRAEKLAQSRNQPVQTPIRQRYLQLPRLDPRIAALARDVTAKSALPADKALALEAYLQSSFSYSLDNQSAATADPLADFLFESRQGHCEYFATAMAVMLRSIGLPSRVVNGFRRGEFNTWSNYFIVRQSDAHSWVEVFLPGAGWVEFDPTPAAADDGGFYFAQAASHLLDAIDVFWTDVITFDRFKQVTFFVTLGSQLRREADRLSFSAHRLTHLGRRWWQDLRMLRGLSPGEILLVLGALAGLALAWRKRRTIGRFWKRKILRRSAAEIAPDYYLELLHIMGKKGFVREPWETPAEFLDRISPQLDTLLPTRITGYYYRSRYGNCPMGDADLADIRSCLKQLRSARLPAQPRRNAS